MKFDSSSYIKEIYRLILILIALILLGLLTGYTWAFIAVGLFLYVLWHVYHINLLIRWLSGSVIEAPPQPWGIWADVFHFIYRVQSQNQKRTKKIQTLLERYKEATEAVPDATMILGRNWKIEWLNKKCKNYLQLRPRKDIGKPLNHLISSARFLSFLESYDYLGECNTALEIDSPDKSRRLSIRLIPFGKRYLLIARDITEFQQLRDVRKDFVANVSHELRTPLTVISGYLETLSEYPGEDEMYAGSINMMQQQSNRMCRIIEDLLLLSKVEANEKNSHSLSMINMPLMLQMLKNEALVVSNGQHHISVEMDKAIPFIQGDESELRSAFSNLVSNAVRYTPDGGKIVIRWYQKNRKYLCFEVEDSGEGIEKQHLDRLTERFYRVEVGRSRATGGTGLGLAIVKHVLNHHQAKLLIHSEPGKGSVFCCEFSGQTLNPA